MNQQASYNYHKLQEHDTLATVAMTYNVSIAELKALNRLRNNEIWSLSQLKLPQRARIPEPADRVNLENADEQRAMICCAIRRLHPELPEFVINSCVDHCLTFKKALNVCEWISQTTAAPRMARQEPNVDPRECLAYLEMNQFNVVRACEAMRADHAWSDQTSAAADKIDVKIPSSKGAIRANRENEGDTCYYSAETELTTTQRKRKIN